MCNSKVCITPTMTDEKKTKSITKVFTKVIGTLFGRKEKKDRKDSEKEKESSIVSEVEVLAEDLNKLKVKADLKDEFAIYYTDTIRDEKKSLESQSSNDSGYSEKNKDVTEDDVFSEKDNALKLKQTVGSVSEKEKAKSKDGEKDLSKALEGLTIGKKKKIVPVTRAPVKSNSHVQPVHPYTRDQVPNMQTQKRFNYQEHGLYSPEESGFLSSPEGAFPAITREEINVVNTDILSGGFMKRSVPQPEEYQDQTYFKLINRITEHPDDANTLEDLVQSKCFLDDLNQFVSIMTVALDEQDSVPELEDIQVQEFNVQGTEFGDVQGPEFGDVQGTEFGGVQGTEFGDVQGAEFAGVQATHFGDVQGTEFGDVQGTEFADIQVSEFEDSEIADIFPTPPRETKQDCPKYKGTYVPFSPPNSVTVNSPISTSELSPSSDKETGEKKVHLKFYKDKMKCLEEDFKKICCDTCDYVEKVKARSANLKEAQRRGSIQAISKVEKGPAFGFLLITLTDLSNRDCTTVDLKILQFCLICHKLVQIDPAVFTTAKGLYLLSRVSQECPSYPELTQCVVTCARAVAAADPGMAAKAFVFTETDEYNNTLLFALVHHGDSHARQLAAIVHKNAVTKPLFNIDHFNNEGRTALHEAVSLHSKQSPRLLTAHALLEHGKASLKLGDTRGFDSAVHLAVNSATCDLDMVMTLFLYVPNVSWNEMSRLRNGERTLTPLEYAKRAKKNRPNYPDLVLQFLVKCRPKTKRPSASE